MVAETEKRKGMMTAAAFAAAMASIKSGSLWEECYMSSDSSRIRAHRHNLQPKSCVYSTKIDNLGQQIIQNYPHQYWVRSSSIELFSLFRRST